MNEEENTMLEAKIMYLLESTATEINYQMMRLEDEIVYRRNLRRVEKMEKKNGCKTSYQKVAPEKASQDGQEKQQSAMKQQEKKLEKGLKVPEWIRRK